MPNLAQTLKSEIQRLAKKEAKRLVDPVKKDNVQLRKDVRDLRKTVDSLQRTNQRLSQKVQPVIESTVEEEAKEQAKHIRPTAKSIRRLRKKFGMTQAEFGKLLDVSGQTITNWENSQGSLKLRKANLKALAAIINLGAREARMKLAEITGEKPVLRKTKGRSATKKASKPRKQTAADKNATTKPKSGKKSTKKTSARKSAKKASSKKGKASAEKAKQASA